MTLYGIENHYEIIEDSEETVLFKTHKKALNYLKQKFDTYAEDGKIESDYDEELKLIIWDEVKETEEFKIYRYGESEIYRLVKYEF